jgi:hypothetical protein
MYLHNIGYKCHKNNFYGVLKELNNACIVE